MFIDYCVTVVGDRLVTVNESMGIEVRLVNTGRVVHTIRTGDDDSNLTTRITPVPGHSELIVTGHSNGAVHLWDIRSKGTRACECVNANAGVGIPKFFKEFLEYVFVTSA